MSARRSSVVLVTLAAVLLAAAAVVRFVVAPGATKLPEDADQTVHYAGKASMLDSAALRSGDTADALKSGIPVTVDRRVRVTSTHGDTAVLQDVMTVRVGGQTLPSSKTYAVDRESREGTSPPASTAVEPSRGALSSAFPPDAARDDSYTYYDSTTRSIVPVRYTGTAEREGRSVNVYEIRIAAPVKDPEVLEPLPAALPKQLLTALVPTLGADAKARLTPDALSALPDPVPLAYTGRSTLVAQVDRQTGIAIDQSVDREIVATTTVAGEPTALLPVSALTFAVTPDSVRDLGDTAASAGLLLTLVTDVAPLVLVAVAVVLLLIRFGPRRNRRPGASAPTDPAAAASA
ncbi:MULTISPECIES: porin PorA family protein [Streptomyces]|uniref:Porin PorA family protein n=1 Tax=Streptomyces lienomycini TaxID=284035 RepID=A0ABV9WLD2_9ACTN|nr:MULTISPECIES: porin PorA family protein [Streptomyces]